MDVEEYSEAHHADAMAKARKVAMATICDIYHKTKDLDSVSSADIEKIAHAVQILNNAK